MATLADTHPTLADWAKTRDPDGKTARIVELMEQSTEVLEDVTFMEGNLPTGHLTTVRTGLPTVYWRMLNQGVQPSKSRTAQITEGIGILESYAEVDVDLAKLNGDVQAYRAQEVGAHFQAHAQEFEQTLWYGNTTTAPKEFHGLSSRYSDLSAPNAQNIVDAGGTGSDNLSVWLICWSPTTVSGIFPKGSVAGIQHRDLGEVTNENTGGTTGARSQMYRDHAQFKAGLALMDWRFAVRIANIDVSDLVANSSPADLTILMAKALHRLPNPNIGRCAFYMNRTAFQQFDVQGIGNVRTGGMTYMEVDGQIRPFFRGISIRRADQLLETEARVV